MSQLQIQIYQTLSHTNTREQRRSDRSWHKMNEGFQWFKFTLDGKIQTEIPQRKPGANLQHSVCNHIYSRVNPTDTNALSSAAKGNLTQTTLQATNQVLPNAKESKQPLLAIRPPCKKIRNQLLENSRSYRNTWTQNNMPWDDHWEP